MQEQKTSGFLNFSDLRVDPPLKRKSILQRKLFAQTFFSPRSFVSYIMKVISELEFSTDCCIVVNAISTTRGTLALFMVPALL